MKVPVGLFVCGMLPRYSLASQFRSKKCCNMHNILRNWTRISTKPTACKQFLPKTRNLNRSECLLGDSGNAPHATISVSAVHPFERFPASGILPNRSASLHWSPLPVTVISSMFNGHVALQISSCTDWTTGKTHQTLSVAVIPALTPQV